LFFTSGIIMLKQRYKLGQILGQGGMAVVYQAMDTVEKRTVAIKQMTVPNTKNQDQIIMRFKRE